MARRCLPEAICGGAESPEAGPSSRDHLVLDLVCPRSLPLCPRAYLEAAPAISPPGARREPKFAWAHFNRGLALAKAGRLLDARVSYDAHSSSIEDFAEALVNRALVELELNDLEPARASDLTAAIKRGRNDLVVFAALGETWARLGRRNEAELLCVAARPRSRQHGRPRRHAA